jgi:hypothetical protein
MCASFPWQQTRRGSGHPDPRSMRAARRPIRASLLVHLAVLTCALALVDRLLRDGALRGQHQRRDGRRVLQRGAGDLGVVDDPGHPEVHSLAGGGIEPHGVVLPADALHHDCPLEAGVAGDEPRRLLQ